MCYVQWGGVAGPRPPTKLTEQHRTSTPYRTTNPYTTYFFAANLAEAGCFRIDAVTFAIVFCRNRWRGGMPKRPAAQRPEAALPEGPSEVPGGPAALPKGPPEGSSVVAAGSPNSAKQRFKDGRSHGRWPTVSAIISAIL